MRNQNSFPVIIFFVIFAIGAGWARAAYDASNVAPSTIIVVSAFIVALLVAISIKIANPWERAIVLRLGRFESLRGPGLFFIVPILDTIPFWIDTRVITTSFKAEK